MKSKRGAMFSIKIELPHEFCRDGSHVRIAVNQDCIAAACSGSNQRINQRESCSRSANNIIASFSDLLIHGHDFIDQFLVNLHEV